MSGVLRLHRWYLGLYVAAVVMQVYAAGLALFGVTSFVPHTVLGYLMIIGALILLVLTAIARLPRRALLFAFLILLLAIAQPMLVLVARSSAPALAALHPVNAVLIVILAMLMRVATTSRRSATAP